jgi:hypothetical protein
MSRPDNSDTVFYGRFGVMPFWRALIMTRVLTCQRLHSEVARHAAKRMATRGGTAAQKSGQLCLAEQPPRSALLNRGGLLVHTGILVVRLLRTTVANTKMYRPQVQLQLDHIGGRQELRRTSVRERWARSKASLRHGIADWDLSFSFCVDVPAGEGVGVRPPAVMGRFLEVRRPRGCAAGPVLQRCWAQCPDQTSPKWDALLTSRR